MKEVLLIETIYGPFQKDLFKYFKYRINKMLGELDITLDTITITDSGNIYIRFFGDDEEFTYNFLKKEFHICKNFEDLKNNVKYFGKFVEVNKYGYGIYVNVGAIHNDTFSDALIPLHKLREQLVQNKKISTRKIIDIYGIINEMPTEILITNIDPGNYKIEAEFSKKQLNRFKKWVDKGLQRVNINGVLNNIIQKVLKRTGHTRDIIKTERLGLFEYSMVCKEDTEAPGIIKDIGPHLPGIEMNAFIPDEIVK